MPTSPHTPPHPQGPLPCHYDRTLGHHVITRHHRDDCPTRTSETGDCPAGGNGCAPCTAPHCLLCNTRHATNDHPYTCPDCLNKVRTDLVELGHDYADLATQAIAAGNNGRLAAAAPIPGGNAQILRGPTVRLDQLRTGRGYRPEHMADIHPTNHRGRSVDPIPPLAVLAQWEDIYRGWFGHTTGRRVTVEGALRYLTDHLTDMANGPAVVDGPDWVAFTRQIRGLRTGLERALHDEQEPERGVECFECGDQLVRRFRDRHRCRHTTPARRQLEAELRRQAAGQAWLRVLRSYPELGYPTSDEDAIAHVTGPELAAARPPAATLVTAARQPCTACAHRSQGGLDDPRAGRGWECPGCRKEYDPGEYATAVRRSLVDGDEQTFGWIHVSFAAEAVSDVVGMTVTPTLVGKWLERGKVSSCCAWHPPRADGRDRHGTRSGLRLVFWPEVVAEANAAVDRMLAAAEKRRERAEQDAAWRRVVLEQVAAGRKLKAAGVRVGKQLRLHPARVAGLLEALEVEVAWRSAVEAGERPEAAARRLGIGEDRLGVLLGTVAA